MPDPGRPFDAPWQAQLFALTVALNEAGVFDWPDWAAAFSEELKGIGPAADGNDGYYTAWLTAFEAFLSDHGHAAGEELARLQTAWQDAAHRTPHGQPITLD